GADAQLVIPRAPQRECGDGGTVLIPGPVGDVQRSSWRAGAAALPRWRGRGLLVDVGVLSRTRDRLRPVDVVPSPNIWHWPDVYEVENRAQDVGGEVWRALAEAFDWTGR